jgi:hypothetical protein
VEPFARAATLLRAKEPSEEEVIADVGDSSLVASSFVPSRQGAT